MILLLGRVKYVVPRDGIFFSPSPRPFPRAVEEESNAGEFIACFLGQNKPLARNGGKKKELRKTKSDTER